MPDREKAIRILEGSYKNFVLRHNGELLTVNELIALLKAQEHEALDMPKPDSEIGCWYDITHNYTLEQVVSALKAQEPHVMTLEEYEAWIDAPFTERNPVFHEERTKRGTVTCWVNTVVCTLREYGKNDRCWTSRPTDEQREKEPWNG